MHRPARLGAGRGSATVPVASADAPQARTGLLGAMVAKATGVNTTQGNATEANTTGANATPAHATSAATGGAVGMASFYGRDHAGRRAADGSIFNPNALTAAHRSLPFGTKVEVTNLDNGRSVVVRITDRGPFVRGRIIDVSAGAARSLDFVGRGVTKVKLVRLAMQ